MRLINTLLKLTLLQVLACQHVLAGITEIEEFVIASNSAQYRKALSDESTTYQVLAQTCEKFGNGWAPAVLDTEEEFEFLRDNMGSFIINYDKLSFVGGSTNITQFGPIDYSDYIPNDSGDFKLRIVQWPYGDRSYQFQYKSEKQKLLPDYDFDTWETTAHSILCERACDSCTGTNLDDWFLDKKLDISSNMKKYRKLVDISAKGLYQWAPKCAEMGEGWAPAVFNTRKEMDFIIQGQKGFSDSRNYWIGGRTRIRLRSLDYSDYIPEQITFPFLGTYYVRVLTGGNSHNFMLKSELHPSLNYGILCEKAATSVLEFSSTKSYYHKIYMNDTRHDYSYYETQCTELGDRWAPTILETEEEWDFIRTADMYVRRFPYQQERYWIGGTTSAYGGLQSNYSSYVPDPDYEGLIGMIVQKYESHNDIRPCWRQAAHVKGILCEKGLA